MVPVRDFTLRPFRHASTSSTTQLGVALVTYVFVGSSYAGGQEKQSSLWLSGRADRRTVQPRDTSCAAKTVMPAAILLGDNSSRGEL